MVLNKGMKGKGIGNSVTINKAQNKNGNDLRNIKISKLIVFKAYFLRIILVSIHLTKKDNDK